MLGGNMLHFTSKMSVKSGMRSVVEFLKRLRMDCLACFGVPVSMRLLQIGTSVAYTLGNCSSA